jgi:hypothetical protein
LISQIACQVVPNLAAMLRRVSPGCTVYQKKPGVEVGVEVGAEGCVGVTVSVRVGVGVRVMVGVEVCVGVGV